VVKGAAGAAAATSLDPDEPSRHAICAGKSAVIAIAQVSVKRDRWSQKCLSGCDTDSGSGRTARQGCALWHHERRCCICMKVNLLAASQSANSHQRTRNRFSVYSVLAARGLAVNGGDERHRFLFWNRCPVPQKFDWSPRLCPFWVA